MTTVDTVTMRRQESITLRADVVQTRQQWIGARVRM